MGSYGMRSDALDTSLEWLANSFMEAVAAQGASGVLLQQVRAVTR